MYLTDFGGDVGARAGAASIFFGSHSYSSDGAAAVAGHSIVDHSRVVIESNSFVNCSASLVSSFAKNSFKVDAHAGAVAVFIGPITLSTENATRTLRVSSPLQIVDSIVSIVNNSFVNCSASVAAQSCLSVDSRTRGGAVFFEISLDVVVANNLSLQFVLTDSTFVGCYVLWSCLSQDTAVFTAAGGAVSFVSALLPMQYPVVVSRCKFIDSSSIGSYFIASQNYSVSGGAMYVNGSMPLHINDCQFNSVNNTGIVVDAVFRSQTDGGGSSLRLVNLLDVYIGGCSFQKLHNRSTSGGESIVLIDRDSVDTRVFSRLMKVSDTSFVSDDSVMLLIIPIELPSFDTLSISNVQFVASNVSTFSVASVASSSVFLSSNSTLGCPASSNVFVANASGTLSMGCGNCPVLNFSYISNDLNLDVIQQLQQSRTSLAALSVCHFSSTDGVPGCPYGIVFCTGTIKVTSGLWMFFENLTKTDSLLSFAPTSAARCPPGFCGCDSSTKSGCPVPAPLDFLAIGNNTALCSSNRTGILCSHCLPGFTATVDETGCMPNDECIRRLPWIWTAVLLSYLIYGLYVALSCLDPRSGIMSSLLFFGQMSQFALPHLPGSTSSFSVTLTKASHFDSLASSYTNVCLGTDLSTFRLILVKLWGPVSVLIFALFWVWVLKRHQRTTKSTSKSARLERQISYFGTLAQCLLLIFSSLASAVFKLVQCINVDGIGNVVFLDGSRFCYDEAWVALVCGVTLLVLAPFWFAYLLLYEKLRPSARYAVCNAYTDQVYYWGAVTLASRMFMSLAYSFAQDPSVGQSSLLLISVLMTLLLIHLQPYVQSATYRVDLLCHVCLVVQFVLSVIIHENESVGVSLAATGWLFHLPIHVTLV